MRIFLSAGEASGDAYGACLIREMSQQAPNSAFEFEAVGGKLLAQEGAALVCDSSTWGAVGITQALKQIPKVTLAYFRIKRALVDGKAGLFVPIDFGFINIRLCRAAKAAGWKVLYFIPPGSWRRDRQGRDLPDLTDAITTPFEWSAKILNGMGARAYWYGHPIRQLVGQSGSDQPRGNSIAILPGSRRHEIQLTLPLIADALKDRPETLEFVVAPSVDLALLQGFWKRLAPNRGDKFTVEEKYQALRSAKVGIVCSGTATLEAALCGCPMVVLYKVSALMHLQGFLMGLKKIRWISLPNIFLQRDLLPEIRGWNVTAGDVRIALEAVLSNPSSQQEGFLELETILGGDHAITETATVAIRLATAR